MILKIFSIFSFCTISNVLLGSTGECEKLWNYSRDGEISRCFKIQDVKIKCAGHSDIDKDHLYELQIEALDYNNFKYFYGYGKMIRGSLCHEHLMQIKQLLKSGTFVCIQGSGENKLKSGEFYARWVGLETKAGKTCW